MDDTLLVNFGAMEHASQSIQRALGTLDDRLKEIHELGRGLTAGWEGEARESYLIRQTGWQDAAGDLMRMLRDIKAALDDSKIQYLETEHRNRDLFRPR